MNGRNILIYLSIITKGNWQEMTDILKSKKVIDFSKAEQAIATIRSKITTILDKDYPQALKDLAMPPYVLYYEGNLSLVNSRNRCISYIGSRKASPYGLRSAKRICLELALEGYSVVSGLASGIDGEAAKAALPYGRAVAVIGNGIDYYYPKEHSDLQRSIKERGLLISEYPFDTPPSPAQFPMRNRLIAALSHTVVVGEAHKRSGTMITVANALAIGRDVCCLPFTAEDDSFCNQLIKDGAALVENASDVFDSLGHIKGKPLS